MELKIRLDEENIDALLTELYAKGCNEVANAIETAYFKHLDEQEERDEFRAYARQYGGVYRALYFKGVHGITYYCEFWDRNENGKVIRRFTTKPLVSSIGTVYGTASTKAYIKSLTNEAIKEGLEEV